MGDRSGPTIRPDTLEERPNPGGLRLRDENLPLLQKKTKLPKVQLLVVFSILTAESIVIQVVSPFIVKLVVETGITEGHVQKIGYYTGLLDSTYYLVKALTVLQWGRLSDRIGRRPVLLTGLLSLCIPVISFGLAHTFSALVASSAMAGAFYGTAVVIKTTLSDISVDTNVAQVFAMIPFTWAIGDTVGPLIGGMLQHPYERFGGVFCGSDFWRTNPYLLPCATAAAIAALTFLVGLFLLKETAPFITECNPQRKTGLQSLRTDDHGNSAEVETPMITEQSPLLINPGISVNLSLCQTPPTLRTILTRRVLWVVMTHSALSTVHQSFYNLHQLVLNTPISNGGLGMSPSMIGACLAVFGIANGTVSTLFFAPLTRRFGTKTLATACASSLIWCLALFPLMNALARPRGQLTPLVWVVFILQLLLSTLPSMAVSCVLIYLRHAAPTSSALGATIGLAETTGSLMRSVGAAATTTLFALSIEHNLLGGGLVYVVLCSVAGVVTIATLLLPEKPWDREG